MIKHGVKHGLHAQTSFFSTCWRKADLVVDLDSSWLDVSLFQNTILKNGLKTWLMMMVNIWLMMVSWDYYPQDMEYILLIYGYIMMMVNDDG